MSFTRIEPHRDLSGLIECYWMAESDNAEPQVQKIIPDGYTELIFHYGDDYRVNISGVWETQAKNLLAGQISSYFNLENTGKPGIIAVKLKPTALTQMFGLNMSDYTDKVADLDTIPIDALSRLTHIIFPMGSLAELTARLDNYFLNLIDFEPHRPAVAATELVFEQNGMVSVKEMAEAAAVGERQLERLFKRYVGIPPKYYARIIRFNYIFQLIEAKNTSWAEIVYRSGYYDQSHFIRDFKAFTGEDPSAYYFDQDNMANFFLKK